MASERINWHGRDLPVVREIVTIDGVETVVEIPDFDDPGARRIIAALAAIPKFEGAGKLAPIYLLEQVARQYIECGGTVEAWHAYETTLGVQRSKTRQPESPFQPFLRWAKGGEPDTTGSLAKLAAPLTEWLELGDKRPSPTAGAPGTSDFAEWLAQNHGYTKVAGGRRQRRGENYSETQSEIAVAFDGRTGLPPGQALARSAEPRPKGEAKYLALRATSGSEEWYTPPQVFDALGCRFDLDVASPGADVVPWIPAEHHFTPSDNGLERDWGNAFVWMNPPYSRETLPLWLQKFRKHGNGIALVIDRTSTRWWQDLCGRADLVLQVNKKINFMRPGDGLTDNNALGSSLVAYGERAVEALKNAAAAGLGTLFKPCPVATLADGDNSKSISENAGTDSDNGMDGKEPVPEEIKAYSGNDYSKSINENEASADVSRAETKTGNPPTSEGENNGSGRIITPEVLAKVERVKATTAARKSAQQTTTQEGKETKKRLIAGAMRSEEATGIYEGIIDFQAVDQSDLVHHWLSGREPVSEDEDACFARLDALGPEHVAYLQTLLARYDGETLYGVIVVILEDNRQTLLEIGNALVEHDYGKTAEDLYDENQALKRRIAELEATAVAAEKQDAE